jgi:hypothetical protein
MSEAYAKTHDCPAQKKRTVGKDGNEEKKHREGEQLEGR